LGYNSSVRKITIKSFAKFNPVLEVLGRDSAAGMHYVSTVLCNLDHFDVVTVEKTGEAASIRSSNGGPPAPDAARLEIVLDGDSDAHLLEVGDRGLSPLQTRSAIPTGAQNTAHKAWRAVCAAFGHTFPARVRLLKRIPAAAGLGGGSGNAAAVIVALVRLFDLEAVPESMAMMAAEIGADVPFFLSGGLMMAEHFGETLYDLGESPPFFAAVLKPASGSSTEEAYKLLDSLLSLEEGVCRSARTTRGFANAIAAGGDFMSFVRNDFDLAMLKHNPDAGLLFGWLQGERADRVVVAGSGSAVIGLFRNEPPSDLPVRAMSQLGGMLECAFIARPAPAGLEVVDWE
jgi:4-diphosphocytidyl-2-C-methyl-D-erythritol kinase